MLRQMEHFKGQLLMLQELNPSLNRRFTQLSLKSSIWLNTIYDVTRVLQGWHPMVYFTGPCVIQFYDMNLFEQYCKIYWW